MVVLLLDRRYGMLGVDMKRLSAVAVVWNLDTVQRFLRARRGSNASSKSRGPMDLGGQMP